MAIKEKENILLHWKNGTSDGNISNQIANTHLHLRKETDISMKLLGKESYLDYTFLSTRSSLNPQTKDKKFKDYIYDLHKTLDLNLELINTSISEWKDNEERKELYLLFNAFKEKYNNKNTKRALLNQKESKILIEKQILHEIKRKIEENSKYHSEKSKEVNENLDSKEEYIKVFEKKLQEVEIYISKATKSLTNSPYEKYKGWKMNEFLEANNKVVRLRFFLKKDMKKIELNINEVKQENMTYKDDDVIETNTIGNACDDNNKKEESDQRIKAYLKYYKNQIRVFQMKIKLLRNCFDNMSDTMKFFYLNRKPNMQRLASSSNKEELNNTANFGNEQLNQNEIKMGEDNVNINKSILNLDMTRKINHFMDFSVVLNKKGDETKFDDFGKTNLGGLGNVTNLNMWDISCINK